MNRFFRLAVLFVVAGVAACGTVQVGQEFNLRTFQDRVERGVTTQNQVRTYYRATGSMSDMSGAELKILQIKFDKHGIVRAYNWSNNEK